MLETRDSCVSSHNLVGLKGLVLLLLLFLYTPLNILFYLPCSRPVSPNTGHSARYLELARKLKQDRIVQLFRK